MRLNVPRFTLPAVAIALAALALTSSVAAADASSLPARATAPSERALVQERYYTSYGTPAPLSSSTTREASDTGGITWLGFSLALLGTLIAGLAAGPGCSAATTATVAPRHCPKPRPRNPHPAGPSSEERSAMHSTQSRRDSARHDAAAPVAAGLALAIRRRRARAQLRPRRPRDAIGRHRRPATRQNPAAHRRREREKPRRAGLFGVRRRGLAFRNWTAPMSRAWARHGSAESHPAS